MDVTDLLAHAAAGQADVALVSLDAPGLDAPAVAHLRTHAVRPVAVVDPAVADGVRSARPAGFRRTVDVRQLDRLADAVLAAAAPSDPADDEPDPGRPARRPGQRVRPSRCGDPTGAPGRTTVALGIAGELARRGADPLLLDVDPWGGAVGQHLGVLDEVSGLLACARCRRPASCPAASSASSAAWPACAWSPACRAPTAGSRSARARSSSSSISAAGRATSCVDTGFCLEDDPAADYAGRAGRNAMTRERDRGRGPPVVVVGTADPVGLSRLARGLTELREHTDGRPVHVVVNRMRAVAGLVGDATWPGWWPGSPTWPDSTSCPTTAARPTARCSPDGCLAELGDSP